MPHLSTQSTAPPASMTDHAAENLRFIRHAMERSATFTAVPGWGGMLLALPLLWWLNSFVRTQLYEVTPTDPASVAGAAVILILAAGIAVLVPSRRALRVNPMTALRDE